MLQVLTMLPSLHAKQAIIEAIHTMGVFESILSLVFVKRCWVLVNPKLLLDVA